MPRSFTRSQMIHQHTQQPTSGRVMVTSVSGGAYQEPPPSCARFKKRSVSAHGALIVAIPQHQDWVEHFQTGQIRHDVGRQIKVLKLDQKLARN